ncbi:GTPase-associated system all-helical protein GASH [Cupriavidus basilensis]|uniref:GTPase-associated system all-helical protein GASH n=1 Tax=Cupriavidus basilensis TaxID=68895 RepID=UPI0020A65577|nr:GTPase-associated system all-helical protein GASH [Cupriavidus basilensis]MCP3024544.1 hypothetical protein [Cupriavidus basilensis]
MKRMGVLYGRLGLAPAPALIEARYEGLVAACEKLDLKHVPNLVGCTLGLKDYGLDDGFLSFFSERDPAFDVKPQDKEAALLAGSAISYAFAETFEIEQALALCLATASFGSARSAIADDQLVDQAELKLSELQTHQAGVPSDRKYHPRGKVLTTALEALSEPASRQNWATGIQNTQTAVEELVQYTEKIAEHAARNDNVVLDYLRHLESEVHVYWWASSGWSADAKQAFKHLGSGETAIRAGKELADKSRSTVGLFAAPALLAMVLERGRDGTPESLTLATAAVAVELSWRKANFQALSEGVHANLMPLTTAMGMAASSDDHNDWQPRFERLTGLQVTQELTIDQLAIQMYRERLVARLLK